MIQTYDEDADETAFAEEFHKSIMEDE